MDNHYHLLIETAESNLSKDMRQLNGVYTRRFNRWHGRVGHVFQSRYKAIVMQKESYLGTGPLLFCNSALYYTSRVKAVVQRSPHRTKSPARLECQF